MHEDECVSIKRQRSRNAYRTKICVRHIQAGAAKSKNSSLSLANEQFTRFGGKADRLLLLSKQFLYVCQQELNLLTAGQ